MAEVRFRRIIVKQHAFALKGTFVDAPRPGEIRARDGYALCVDGLLEGVYDALPDAWRHVEVEDYTGRLIIPGMTDLHLHASQYGYCGTAMDVELLQWLERYTYPEEARYADPAYARSAYRRFVEDLRHTTTTRSCIFATVHTDGTLELMRLMEEAGLPAFVGKLSMDRNCPDFYREKDGPAQTRRWLDACRAEGFRLALPMITPRFTPTITDGYMKAIGELAAEYHVPVQSHLSENDDEIAWVKELCPDTAFYGESYARYGLFGGECPTVMAHCISCPADEDALIMRQGVMIAHCPTSNSNVIAGIAPAARYLREGYRIGIGSDVSGGHTLNLLAVMVCAIEMSKVRWKYMEKSVAPLTLPEAFYMATTGGGSFFGNVGLFEKGYDFDAVVMDETPWASHLSFDAAERLERCVYRSDGRPVAKFARGRRIL